MHGHPLAKGALYYELYQTIFLMGQGHLQNNIELLISCPVARCNELYEEKS
jgi:hypothetical protein